MEWGILVDNLNVMVVLESLDDLGRLGRTVTHLANDDVHPGNGLAMLGTRRVKVALTHYC